MNAIWTCFSFCGVKGPGRAASITGVQRSYKCQVHPWKPYKWQPRLQCWLVPGLGKQMPSFCPVTCPHMTPAARRPSLRSLLSQGSSGLGLSLNCKPMQSSPEALHLAPLCRAPFWPLGRREENNRPCSLGAQPDRGDRHAKKCTASSWVTSKGRHVCELANRDPSVGEKGSGCQEKQLHRGYDTRLSCEGVCLADK